MFHPIKNLFFTCTCSEVWYGTNFLICVHTDTFQAVQKFWSRMSILKRFAPYRIYCDTCPFVHVPYSTKCLWDVSQLTRVSPYKLSCGKCYTVQKVLWHVYPCTKCLVTRVQKDTCSTGHGFLLHGTILSRVTVYQISCDICPDFHVSYWLDIFDMWPFGHLWNSSNVLVTHVQWVNSHTVQSFVYKRVKFDTCISFPFLTRVHIDKCRTVQYFVFLVSPCGCTLL